MNLIKLTLLTVTALTLNACFNSKAESTENELKLRYRKSLLPNKIDSALKFVVAERMNRNFAILIDYHMHSGLKRGYLVDLKNKIAFDSFLVSHGCGSNPWGEDNSKDKPEFSNEFESHCSSLGKYKIGERGYSDWGIHVKYLMHGLEKSNNNALKRFIVLHGWENVSQQETFPAGTPEGWGCPAVANSTMKQLDSLLGIHKNTLLWTY